MSEAEARPSTQVVAGLPLQVETVSDTAKIPYCLVGHRGVAFPTIP